jgi:hypothetical protein
VAGLDPATHVFLCSNIEDVDARDKPGQGVFSLLGCWGQL